MTVNIPQNLDVVFVNELKATEKAMSQELQRSGKWVSIWRIVGKYSNISIFNVFGIVLSYFPPVLIIGIKVFQFYP